MHGRPVTVVSRSINSVFQNGHLKKVKHQLSIGNLPVF